MVLEDMLMRIPQVAMNWIQTMDLEYLLGTIRQGNRSKNHPNESRVDS
jgi:hypothetical protein